MKFDFGVLGLNSAALVVQRYTPVRVSDLLDLILMLLNLGSTLWDREVSLLVIFWLGFTLKGRQLLGLLFEADKTIL